jgi:hypothetical protein
MFLIYFSINAISDMEKTPFNRIRKVLLVSPYFIAQMAEKHAAYKTLIFLIKERPASSALKRTKTPTTFLSR